MRIVVALVHTHGIFFTEYSGDRHLGARLADTARHNYQLDLFLLEIASCDFFESSLYEVLKHILFSIREKPARSELAQILRIPGEARLVSHAFTRGSRNIMIPWRTVNNLIGPLL